MSPRTTAQNAAAPRNDRHSAVGLAVAFGIVLAVTAILAPAWLLIGPPSDHGRNPVAGVVDACQEGLRRGSLAAVGLVSAGILLMWGASVVLTALLVAVRTGLFATHAARALARMSREVEVFADGRPVPVRVLPCDSAEAFTAGLFRPRIYLGAGVIGRLDARELEAVALHELAHVRRRDPLRCWLVQTIATSLWWPGMRPLPARHRAVREAEADRFAIERMGDDAPLLRALLRVDAVPAAAGLSPLTSERRQELRLLRRAREERAGFPALTLLSGVGLFVLLMVTATLGLSDWQTFWLCPDGTTMTV